jgi:hypothetical protein
MDRIVAIGSPLPAWPAPASAGRDAASIQDVPWVSPPELAAAAALDPAAVYSARPEDPATDQQRMLHLISHVDAACFISLLQTMDPMPYDYRARAEYKRFYAQLHEVLEVPVQSLDSAPADRPADPAR